MIEWPRVSFVGAEPVEPPRDEMVRMRVLYGAMLPVVLPELSGMVCEIRPAMVPILAKEEPSSRRIAIRIAREMTVSRSRRAKVAIRRVFLGMEIEQLSRIILAAAAAVEPAIQEARENAKSRQRARRRGLGVRHVV